MITQVCALICAFAVLIGDLQNPQRADATDAKIDMSIRTLALSKTETPVWIASVEITNTTDQPFEIDIDDLRSMLAAVPLQSEDGAIWLLISSPSGPSPRPRPHPQLVVLPPKSTVHHRLVAAHTVKLVTLQQYTKGVSGAAPNVGTKFQYVRCGKVDVRRGSMPMVATYQGMGTLTIAAD